MVVIMSKRYPPEVREKAVRLALERLDEFESPYAAARAIGPMVDVHYETLRVWIKKALAEGARLLHSRRRGCPHTAVVVPALARAYTHMDPRLHGMLTWDRGMELAAHKRFTTDTGVDVFFAA